jgi:hypothetical protein
MSKPPLPADLSATTLVSFHDRPTRVDVSQIAKPLPPGADLRGFLATLPPLLKADELRAVVAAIVTARRRGRPVVVGIGGHVVKCGLSPLLIQAMSEGVVTAVMMNGGASIHDLELGWFGRTSEDVAAGLPHGRFGMVRETGDRLYRALRARDGGMGELLGASLVTAPHADVSILAAGVRHAVPVLVHVAIGADTVHMHPEADGALLGHTSFVDFRRLVTLLRGLGDGGCYLNIGSAVQLPEVFLKALNLARNLEGSIDGFTTVDLDMVRRYRPTENVLHRPVQPSRPGDDGAGRSYALTGHHEIMVPLLFHLVLSELRDAV